MTTEQRPVDPQDGMPGRLDALPLTVISRFDRAAGALYGLRLHAPHEASLGALVDALVCGAELSVDDPSVDDAALEVRCIDGGLQLKRGRHGCAGQWRAATRADAVAWLTTGLTGCPARVVALWVPLH